MITAATTEELEFLGGLFEPGDIIELRAIPSAGGSPKSQWATLAGVPELLPWVRMQERQKLHIYFGANPRKAMGGKKASDVLLARCVFADFDKQATLDHATSCIEAAGLPRPTILMESGGGIHAWWRLTEELHDLAAWTVRQKALAKALGSDRTVHDAPRIMRLAATINWKYAEQPVARVVEFNPELRYAFSEVMPTLDMGDVSRRFIYSGRLLPSGGRRETMFTVACDLKARGWDESDATDVLMKRMNCVGLSAEELADCPRQIHNAFTGSRTPLPAGDATSVPDSGEGVHAELNGHARADAAAKKAAQREAKKAAQLAAVIESAVSGAAHPLDLKKPHTLDEKAAARRLAMEAAGSLRYCGQWQKWLHWDGRRWRVDADNGAAVEAAKRLGDSLWSELSGGIQELSRAEQDAAFAFVRGMGSAKRLFGIVSLLKSEPAIAVRVEQLDRQPFLLNLRNGTLDLTTLDLKPHDPRHLITQMAEVEYGEQAESELWERFINDATEGDGPELAAFLQRAAGAALTGSVRDEVLYCHYGRGANGKSTYLDALRHLLGDYAGVAPPSFLAHRNTDGHPTELAMMHGKRLVAAIEMEAGCRMRESLVKSLTGGDAVQARRMREDFWTLEPTWKVHVSFNDAPRVTGTDDGIKRRLCVIPWRVSFSGSRRDSTLKERLCADGPERGGILNWAIAGLRAWQAGGIAPPDCVKAFTEDFTRQQDSFGQFLDECCEVGPGFRAESTSLYREFTAWLERRGESATIWTSNRVASELVRRGFTKEPRRTGGMHRGKYFYAGVGLLSATER